MKGMCLWILLTLLWCSLYAQEPAATGSPGFKEGYRPDKPLTEVRGYLIYITYDWVFQPCEDSSISLFNALNDQSFTPGTFDADFGVHFLPLEGIGEKAFLQYYDYQYNRKVWDTVYYFYGKMALSFNDSTLNSTRSPCWFSLYHQEKVFDVGCQYRSNCIFSVEPLMERDKKVYLAYLESEGYPLPKWSEGWKPGGARYSNPKQETVH